MSSVPNEEHGVFPTDTVQFDDFEVSYLGEGPSPDLICLGSDDGRLLLTSVGAEIKQGPHVRLGTPLQASESCEAINGAAFIGKHVAVSTRNAISLFITHPSNRNEDQRAVFPAGAHGVIGSPSGLFVAPLGTPGVLFIVPEEGETPRIKISRAKDREFYFYRVAALVASQAPEVLVFATRLGGITSMAASGPDQRRRLSWVTFPELDVVDVCPLGAGLREPAACAVGKDRTLVMFRDVLHDRKPAAFRVDGVKGTAYRVFSARGHLFLLTSSGMYVFYTLASRFLAGERVEGTRTSVREFPVEAVDASIVFDRYLWVVMPDELHRFDLDLLSATRMKDTSLDAGWDSEPAHVTPEWGSEELEATPTTVGSAVD